MFCTSKFEEQLVAAPISMFPIGSFYYYGGFEGSSIPSGIYKITKHEKSDDLDDYVIHCGTLELPLQLPMCAAVQLQDSLNQSECKCLWASEQVRRFHNLTMKGKE